MIEGSNTSALLGLHGMAMTGIEVADEVTITIEPDDGPPVNGSDAVFAAVATAAWFRTDWSPDWPTNP